MAQPDTITIKFKAEDKGLTKAIQKLDKATKSLLNSQAKLIDKEIKRNKTVFKGRNQLKGMFLELRKVNSGFRQAGVSNELFTKALKGNRVALRQVKEQVKKYTASLSMANKGILDTEHSTRILGGSFAVLRSKLLLVSFGSLLVKQSIGKLVNAQSMQEDSEKKLSTAIGRRSQELLDFASAQQQVTTFGDEETIQAMSLIGAYTDNEEAIKKLTVASMDLASAKGMDLNTAVDLVSKSVFSSTNALSRYGVTIEGTEGSTERLLSATTALSRMYGGQAKAQAETMSGSLKQMTNAVGDTAEAMGRLISGPVIAFANLLKDVAEGINSVVDGANKLKEGIKNNDTERRKENKTIEEQIKLLKEQGRAITGELSGKEFLAKMKGEEHRQDRQKVIDLIQQIKTLRSLQENEQFLEAERERRRTKEQDSASAEAEWINSFIEKQKELVAQKQQEIDQVDFLIEMYPALAKALGLVEDESDNTADNMKKLAELASRTAGSFAKSLLMGDDLTDAIKRATINMVVMVAEAKLMEYFTRKAKENMEAIQTGGTSTIFRGLQKLGSFIFGHDGGMVTANGIKRFHNGGLASDEVPAVLQQGEFVLSRSAVQSIGLESVRAMNEGRGGSNVEVHIHGGVVQEDYVMNELLPAINKAKALA